MFFELDGPGFWVILSPLILRRTDPTDTQSRIWHNSGCLYWTVINYFKQPLETGCDPTQEGRFVAQWVQKVLYMCLNTESGDNVLWSNTPSWHNDALMQKDLQKSNLVDRCKFELDEPVFFKSIYSERGRPRGCTMANFVQIRYWRTLQAGHRSCMPHLSGAKGRHLRQQCYEECHIFVDQVGYGHECEIGDSCI